MDEILFEEIQSRGGWQNDFNTDEVGYEKPGVASFYTYKGQTWLICAYDDGTRSVEPINEEEDY